MPERLMIQGSTTFTAQHLKVARLTRIFYQKFRMKTLPIPLKKSPIYSAELQYKLYMLSMQLYFIFNASSFLFIGRLFLKALKLNAVMQFSLFDS
jgi:sulfur relay (sulfurtransferase) DsrC/TusE family protein